MSLEAGHLTWLYGRKWIHIQIRPLVTDVTGLGNLKKSIPAEKKSQSSASFWFQMSSLEKSIPSIFCMRQDTSRLPGTAVHIVKKSSGLTFVLSYTEYTTARRYSCQPFTVDFSFIFILILSNIIVCKNDIISQLSQTFFTKQHYPQVIVKFAFLW